jgi:hypothetical protein
LFELASDFVRARRARRLWRMAWRLRLWAHSTRAAARQRRVKDSKDVVAMPLNRSSRTAHSTPRRLRPVNPSCRGGVSSVLRLAQPGAQRLPNTLDLSDWVSRAASVVLPVTGPHFDIGA